MQRRPGSALSGRPRADTTPRRSREIVSHSSARLILAIALVVFGGYRALFLPGLLTGSSPLLFAGFLLQAVSGIAAGFAVERGAAWAPHALVVLGASIAATALVEGFLLEIVAALRALLEALLALAVCVALAAWIGRAPRSTRAEPVG